MLLLRWQRQFLARKIRRIPVSCVCTSVHFCSMPSAKLFRRGSPSPIFSKNGNCPPKHRAKVARILVQPFAEPRAEDMCEMQSHLVSVKVPPKSKRVVYQPKRTPPQNLMDEIRHSQSHLLDCRAVLTHPVVLLPHFLQHLMPCRGQSHNLIPQFFSAVHFTGNARERFHELFVSITTITQNVFVIEIGSFQSTLGSPLAQHLYGLQIGRLSEAGTLFHLCQQGFFLIRRQRLWLLKMFGLLFMAMVRWLII